MESIKELIMKKQLKLLVKTFFILSISVYFSACESDRFIPSEDGEVINSGIEELNSFGLNDLEVMKSELEKNGIDVSGIELIAEDDSPQTRGIIVENPLVKAIKVTTKTPHPDRSGSYIDVSGVLLVPRKTILTQFKNFRIIIVPPPTYTYNGAAPSIAFKKMALFGEDWLLNFMYFWTLQAQCGSVVFIPDYPGYGDSYGKCFHPYLDSKALVNSTLDLFKSAKRTLSANGYRYQNDVLISGYSQGGFVAASLAREIETNPSHGFNVKLLVTGGTPCNLKHIADIVRHSDYVDHTYFLPYGLWGYKENAYPQINVEDFLQEPYASESKAYYDGTHQDLNDFFPHTPAEVYTEKFMDDIDIDPSIQYINEILEENSVKPWKNKCKFVMTHGVGDVSVYYQNAKDFAEEHKEAGGKVTFYPTLGDHLVGFVPYFTKASVYIGLYR